MDNRIRPFHIDIPEFELQDLTARLAHGRYPEPLPAEDWSVGVPLDELRDLVGYWCTTFDWRALEARVNELPQFTTEIDGQQVHFLHVESASPDAVPLLLIHGWPGSFLEFTGLIPLLADFHLVIPSVPGFAFSTPLAGRDWTTTKVATAFAELMSRLGYEHYAAQGGDYGAGVAPELARVDPAHCFAVHVNGSAGAPLSEPSEEDLAAFSDVEEDRYRRVGEFMQHEIGYVSIQSTRPQLVGELLSDSPVAQLAWMFDKFRNWTFPFDASAEDGLGRDQILGHVALYWFTRSAASSAYTVYAAEAGAWGVRPERPAAPLGAIMFAHDIGIRRLAEQQYDVVHWKEVNDRGGHFAAMEEPELLAADIRAFVGSIG